jgi:glycerol-3-phosphate acyltransferase PlsY
MADEGLKQVADTVSVATGVGALAGVLPALSALVTIVWMSIRIWETDTVQRLCGRGKS